MDINLTNLGSRY